MFDLPNTLSILSFLLEFVSTVQRLELTVSTGRRKRVENPDIQKCVFASIPEATNLDVCAGIV